jgi:hypothetical protein
MMSSVIAFGSQVEILCHTFNSDPQEMAFFFLSKGEISKASDQALNASKPSFTKCITMSMTEIHFTWQFNTHMHTHIYN